jgi:hypothetical protein
MKKIISILLLAAVLLSLIGCDEEYEPVASSEIESQVVMTMSLDGEKYNVKYELYRAMFLNLRASVDGGDSSVWNGAEKEKYIAKIDGMIKEQIAQIYSVFHVAKKIGIDIHSEEYDKQVKDYIAASVNGGYMDSIEIEGFGGDYGKYLEYLKENNLNYSVQDLLIRYSLASDDVFVHYKGTLENEEFLEHAKPGALKYTEEDVLAFYNSDDCVRVIRAFLPKDFNTAEGAEEIRKQIAEKAKYGENDVALYIINKTLTGGEDVMNGDVIAKHNLYTGYYSEMVEEAFSLKMYEVSRVMEVVTGAEDGYVILYKTVKNSSHFDKCYEQIASTYVDNEVGKIFDTAGDQLLETLQFSQLLSDLDRASISMD